MTIDEAIQHCEEVADTPCFTDEEARCYSEHRQLAEWLKELKAYREQSGDAISRKYILDLINTKGANLDDDLLIVEQWIQDAPSVNPHPIECGDAISRQAVDNMLYIWLEPDDAERMILHLDEIPSVTPQQRTGRWEYRNIANSTIVGYWCDNCHIGSSRTYNYCPSCGAKMEVES